MWLKLKSCTPYCQATSCGRCTCRPPPSSSSRGPGRFKNSWKITWGFLCRAVHDWIEWHSLTLLPGPNCVTVSGGSGKIPKMLSLDMSQNQIGIWSCFQVAYQLVFQESFLTYWIGPQLLAGEVSHPGPGQPWRDHCPLHHHPSLQLQRQPSADSLS